LQIFAVLMIGLIVVIAREPAVEEHGAIGRADDSRQFTER
jgi:hypothetical protein